VAGSGGAPVAVATGQVGPARLGRHPEDALGAVLVGILRVGALGLLGQQRSVLLLEGVKDVLQKQQTEADVLIFGGVHAAAQGVGHLPELGFVADVGGGRVRPARVVLSLRQWLPHSIVALGRCLGTPNSESGSSGFPGKHGGPVGLFRETVC